MALQKKLDKVLGEIPDLKPAPFGDGNELLFDWNDCPNEKDFEIKQKIFIDNYMACGNASKAALAAGYSPKSAFLSGSQLLMKAHIRKEINRRLSMYALTAEEVVRRISDIARGDISEFIVTKQRYESRKVKIPLKDIIAREKVKFKILDNYLNKIKLSGQTDGEKEVEKVKLARSIMQMKAELEENPEAYRIERGEPVLVDYADLDLTKVHDVNCNGKIKSIRQGKYGLEVEFYAADVALYELARIMGLQKQNDKPQLPSINIDIDVNKKLLDLFEQNSDKKPSENNFVQDAIIVE